MALAPLLLLLPLASAMFLQTPCGGCSSGCGQAACLPFINLNLNLGCPIPAPCAPCAQYPPCPASTGYIQQPVGSVIQQQASVQQPFAGQSQIVQQGQPRPQLGNMRSDNQPFEYASAPIPDGEAHYDEDQQATIFYETLPNGESQLIVPKGSYVYAIKSEDGSPYANPTVLYHGEPARAAAAKTSHKKQPIELKKKSHIVSRDIEDEEAAEEEKEELGGDDYEDEQQAPVQQVVVEEETPHVIAPPIAFQFSPLMHDDVVSDEDSESAEFIDSEERDTIEESINDLYKHTKTHHKEEEEDSVQKDVLDLKKCNSRRLYEIMLENINESSSSSKRGINIKAEKEFGSAIDVICSRGHFSYVFASNLYCEASKGHVTCVAFRQAVPASKS